MKTTFSLDKSHRETSFWAPLEAGRLLVKGAPEGSRFQLLDGCGTCYMDQRARDGAKFRVRGAPGAHTAMLVACEGRRWRKLRSL